MIGGLGGLGGPGGELAKATCSRAGCREAATWRIEWRNPRIHTGDRSKTWLACEEHVGYLRDFLEARSFPVEVGPFEASETSVEIDSAPNAATRSDS
ncbi:hypothetical protein [Agromyces sp. ISL-38]|uniref:hypothetical protein n=1 Tax=Agromyces sp. ISL-38 TaxID=2819107 RepID=UPI001BE685B5|nr:hypothetical protein [Agromyces sp. ISL-38]MBT2515872.1 hypothetical protein [Streptomyces sp. ISL-90]